MATDGNDPKGRGRRLFGSRRRQAAPAERQAEQAPPPPPEPSPGGSASGGRYIPTPPANPAAEPAADASPSPDVPVATDEVANTVESAENDQATDGEIRSGSAVAPQAATPEAPARVAAPAPTSTFSSNQPSDLTPSADPLQARAEGGRVEPPVVAAAPVTPAPPTPVPPAPLTSVAVPVQTPVAEPVTAPAPDPEPEPPAPKARAGNVGLPGSEERGRSVDEAEAHGDEDEVPASYELPRIIAIANQKGGVGKTTTSVNLGASLAELGYRVLVVDLDPQGNATTGLGINARNLQASVYDVIMTNAAIEDCVEPTSLKNLFVAPATIDLAGAEIELVPAFSRELKLRRALEEVRDEYDYVLIDCPPSLGLLTVNGLAAADDVIVPIQCEYYALEGLSQLIRNVTLVRTNLNPKLDVRGIVLTMYDARTKLADQVEQEVREHFGPRVYQTVVPRTVRLSEAPSFGQPIIVFDSTSRGAVAYRELAKEVSSGATRRAG